MARLKIITAPDPVLKTRAEKVRGIDSDTKKLIKNMVETRRSEACIGLAAPQVGESKRIIVVELTKKELGEETVESPIPLTILINPELVKISKNLIEDWEGCLSIPDTWGLVERPENVAVKGLDQNGKGVTISAKGLFARALIHEIDHLDGILFTEHIRDLEKIHKHAPSEKEEGEVAF